MIESAALPILPRITRFAVVIRSYISRRFNTSVTGAGVAIRDAFRIPRRVREYVLSFPWGPVGDADAVDVRVFDSCAIDIVESIG